MKKRNRIIIVAASFFFATIYALPNLALMFAIATILINKWISAIACLIFAWHTAKLVESAYRRFLNDDKPVRNDGEQLDNTEQKEWIHGEGYSYYIENDEITFQFRDIKDDGRQVARLIFMREKFFKDK